MAEITTERKRLWMSGAKMACRLYQRRGCEECANSEECGRRYAAILADLEYAERARAQRPKVAEMAVATRDILADDDLMALVGDRAMIGRLAAALAALED